MCLYVNPEATLRYRALLEAQPGPSVVWKALGLTDNNIFCSPVYDAHWQEGWMISDREAWASPVVSTGRAVHRGIHVFTRLPPVQHHSAGLFARVVIPVWVWAEDLVGEDAAGEAVFNRVYVPIGTLERARKIAAGDILHIRDCPVLDA